MSATPPSQLPRPLRLWPGVIAALVIVIGIVVVPALAPSFGSYTFFAGIAASVAAVLWWLFFSRAPWLERLGVVAAMAVAVYVVSFFVHRSIENGMMGLMLYRAGSERRRSTCRSNDDEASDIRTCRIICTFDGGDRSTRMARIPRTATGQRDP